MLREPDVQSMLLRRKPAHSLAQDLYCDPGDYDLERLTEVWVATNDEGPGGGREQPAPHPVAGL